MPVLDEVLAANEQYAASFGDKGELALPPARRLRDPHLHGRPPRPGEVRRPREGDAHVIRNAGGRASDDAIRSLVISYKLLGTQEWFVIHHTTAAWSSSPTTSCAACSSRAWRPPRSATTASTTSGSGPGLDRGEVHRLADDLATTQSSVVEDVARIRNHPLVPGRSRSTATSTT